MTPEEHQMLILLFANQRKQIATIWEAMKSKELVAPDDIPAFESVTSQSEPEIAECFRRAMADYYEAATACGVPMPPEIEAICKKESERNPPKSDL